LSPKIVFSKNKSARQGTMTMPGSNRYRVGGNDIAG